MIKHMKLILQIIATRIDKLLVMIGSVFSHGIMNRRHFMSVMIASAFSLIGSAFSHGMMHRRYRMNVPSTLPKPKSARWLQELEKVLELEILSMNQYEADSSKFRAHMPYMRVIPDEHNHVHWISQLFSAYELKPDPKILPLNETADLTGAYILCIQLEENLIPRYETLIGTAQDDTTKLVIGRILQETRMHYFMFSHALRMGGMMGHRRGMGWRRGRRGGMRGW